jgi:hypothetical protein
MEGSQKAMSDKPALRGDIQAKLKESVRAKFQELLTDKEIDKFVDDVVGEFKTDMKSKVETILQEELKVYVQQYLKEKVSNHFDGNRPKYDQVIQNAIVRALPDMFESLLGGMIQSGIQLASNNNRY